MSKEPRCYECGHILPDINAACPACLPNWNENVASPVGPDLTKGQHMEQERWSDFATGPDTRQADMVSREKVIELLREEIQHVELQVGAQLEELIDKVKSL